LTVSQREGVHAKLFRSPGKPQKKKREKKRTIHQLSLRETRLGG